MIPPQLRGSMMEAKAQHLRFDNLEEKKLKLEKNREEEKGKKKRKNQAPKCVQETRLIGNDFCWVA